MYCVCRRGRGTQTGHAIGTVGVHEAFVLLGQKEQHEAHAVARKAEHVTCGDGGGNGEGMCGGGGGVDGFGGDGGGKVGGVDGGGCGAPVDVYQAMFRPQQVTRSA